MQDELIPLVEDHKTAKEMMEVLEAKHGAKSETHVNYCFKTLMGCTWKRETMRLTISIIWHY